MVQPLIDKLHLDDVLVKFSVWRRYHMVSVVWLAWGMMYSAMSYMNYVFVAEQVGYRFLDHHNIPFFTHSISLHFHIFSITLAQGCADNSSDVDLEGISSFNTSRERCAGAEPCARWIYDKPSLVAEFQLACQDWKRTMVGTVHSFGYMTGILVLGALSDRFGRKMTGVVSGLMCTAFGLAKSFTTDYWAFIVFEFFEASVDPYAPFFTLAIEIVAPESRFTYAAICHCGVALGGILFPLIAWLFPYWRTLVRVWYAHGILFILSFYFLDESPRWLLSKGKTSEAVKIIKKISKTNGIDIKEDLNLLSYKKVERSSFSQALADTFKSFILLKRFFVCCTWWIASTFVYHGLLLNSVALNGERHLNYGLSILMRIPSNIAAVHIMKKLNRRLPLLITFFACALLCVCQPFVPKDIQWLGVSVYMAGQILSSAFFAITYVFTSELFPTHTRNSMQSLCSSVGRIGAVLSTQTPLLLVYWSGLPTVLFGGVALSAGLATLLVPDTADKTLPDTVGQAEALGDDKLTNRRRGVTDD